MKICSIFCLLSLVIVFNSCKNNEQRNTLRVATAANLRFAMEEVNDAFEKQTGINVEMITASSGKLTAQIKSGAPYDIFLSANYKYPNTLYKEGFTIGEPILFCKGYLVIWTNKEYELDSTLAGLTNPEIKKIVIANPQNAPYGIVAEEVLKNAGYYNSIKPKLIFAENVGQLNQYIINKAADIGITAKSAVLAPKTSGIGVWQELPIELYSPVKQYVVRLKTKGVAAKMTQRYIEYLSGFETNELLQKYGYCTK